MIPWFLLRRISHCAYEDGGREHHGKITKIRLIEGKVNENFQETVFLKEMSLHGLRTDVHKVNSRRVNLLS